jgi:hypothetical protein
LLAICNMNKIGLITLKKSIYQPNQEDKSYH